MSSGAPVGTGFHSLRHFYASLLDPPRGVGQGRTRPTGPCQRGRGRSTRIRIFGPTARTGREPRSTKCSVLVCHLRVTPRTLAPKTPGQAGGDGESACRRGSVRRPASRRGGVAIHLSGLPGDIGRATRPTFWPCSGWGLPSRPGHPDRWCALTAPFHPCLCTASRAIGGLFSVALSCESPRLAVSQHPALRSPDLPQPAAAPKHRPGRGHPADSPSPPPLSHVPARIVAYSVAEAPKR